MISVQQVFKELHDNLSPKCCGKFMFSTILLRMLDLSSFTIDAKTHVNKINDSNVMILKEFMQTTILPRAQQVLSVTNARTMQSVLFR